MAIPIRQIAERLAQNAEAICRHYLDNGRKSGRHWIVGDAYNTKGRSMFVRLTGPTYGPGAAGKWTENVAPRFMLRRCVLAQPRGKLGGSTQHNVSALREVRDAP